MRINIIQLVGSWSHTIIPYPLLGLLIIVWQDMSKYC